jgi:hypothetical protein
LPHFAERTFTAYTGFDDKVVLATAQV